MSPPCTYTRLNPSVAASRSVHRGAPRPHRRPPAARPHRRPGCVHPDTSASRSPPATSPISAPRRSAALPGPPAHRSTRCLWPTALAHRGFGYPALLRRSAPTWPHSRSGRPKHRDLPEPQPHVLAESESPAVSADPSPLMKTPWATIFARPTSVSLEIVTSAAPSTRTLTTASPSAPFWITAQVAWVFWPQTHQRSPPCCEESGNLRAGGPGLNDIRPRVLQTPDLRRQRVTKRWRCPRKVGHRRPTCGRARPPPLLPLLLRAATPQEEREENWLALVQTTAQVINKWPAQPGVIRVPTTVT